MSIAVNPLDPNNLVVAAHAPVTARFETLNTYYSSNGGYTWNVRRLGRDPNDANQQDGDGVSKNYRFDPAVTFDRNGNVYVAYGAGFPDNDRITLVVAKSTTGGESFDHFEEATRTRYGLDKWTIAAGPTTNPNDPDRDNIYVAYTRQFETNTEIRLAVSEDSGESFSGDTRINTDSNDSALGPAVAVARDGRVIVAWTDNNDDPQQSIIKVAWSDDDGESFSAPQLVRTTSIVGPEGNYVLTAQPHRGIRQLASVATDRTAKTHGGRVYVAYTVLGSSPDDTNIEVAYTDNLAAGTWTYVRVNDDAPNNSQGLTQFLPWLSSDPVTGNPVAIWYDTRDDPLNERVEVFVGYSVDGGATWENVQVSSRRSNESASNVYRSSGNDFLEYIGVAVLNDVVHPVWADNGLDAADLDIHTQVLRLNELPIMLGSCLVSEGLCYETTAECCDGLGGLFGPGDECPDGLCCRPADTCIEVPDTECSIIGGVFLPNANCVLEPVGCCLGDSCVDTSIECCGLLHDADVLTAPCGAEGTCCTRDGNCNPSTEECCVALGGTFVPGEFRDDVCGGTHGACCLGDGGCAESTAECCAAMGGTYDENGSCGISVGACCLGSGECIETTSGCCQMAGGTFSQDSTCGGTSSCIINGECVDTSQACCQLSGGTFDAGSSCSAAGCDPFEGLAQRMDEPPDVASIQAVVASEQFGGRAGPGPGLGVSVETDPNDGAPVLVVIGTGNADTIRLLLSGDGAAMEVHDLVTGPSPVAPPIPLVDFDRIRIDALDGDDIVVLDDSGGSIAAVKPFAIDGGDGENTIIGGTGNMSVSEVMGHLNALLAAQDLIDMADDIVAVAGADQPPGFGDDLLSDAVNLVDAAYSNLVLPSTDAIEQATNDLVLPAGDFVAAAADPDGGPMVDALDLLAEAYDTLVLPAMDMRNSAQFSSDGLGAKAMSYRDAGLAMRAEFMGLQDRISADYVDPANGGSSNFLATLDSLQMDVNSILFPTAQPGCDDDNEPNPDTDGVPETDPTDVCTQLQDLTDCMEYEICRFERSADACAKAADWMVADAEDFGEGAEDDFLPSGHSIIDDADALASAANDFDTMSAKPYAVSVESFMANIESTIEGASANLESTVESTVLANADDIELQATAGVETKTAMIESHAEQIIEMAQALIDEHISALEAAQGVAVTARGAGCGNINTQNTIIGGPGPNLLLGTQFNDLIRGRGGFDLIVGLGGDDRLFGDDGIDIIFGGDGTNEIHGGKGIDVLIGGPEADCIYGDDSLDIIVGLDGDDEAHGGNYIDVILGGPNADRLYGDDGIDIIVGGTGDDNPIDGGNCIDVLIGGPGNDTMYGGAGQTLNIGNAFSIELGNVLLGRDGDDTMHGDDGSGSGVGIDVMLGGIGDDLVDGANGGDLTVGTFTIKIGNLLFGGPDDDDLRDRDGIGLLFGGTGSDIMHAGKGSLISFAGGDFTLQMGDLLFGGSDDGDDFMHGDDATGADDSRVACDEINLSMCGLPAAGDDGDIDLFFGRGGCDLMCGQHGGDLHVSGFDFKIGNLFFGADGNDVMQGRDGLEIMFGGMGDDVMAGGDGAELTFASGNFSLQLGDLMFGQAGNDAIHGDQPASPAGSDPNDPDPTDGIDFIFAGAGDDSVYAGGGGRLEIQSFELLIGNFVFGSEGNDVLWGDYSDTDPNALTRKGIDFFFAGDGDDEIRGGPGAKIEIGPAVDPFKIEFGNLMFGSQGSDRIDGGNGLDLIFCGDGDDGPVRAFDGIDVVFGAAGNDDLSGENGGDIKIPGVPIEIPFGNIMFGGDGEDTMRSKGRAPLDPNDIASLGDIDILFGNDCNDVIYAGNGLLDLVFGNLGNDIICGEGGIDILFGNAGEDAICGGPGILDIIFGNENDDCLSGDDCLDDPEHGCAAPMCGGSSGINSALDIVFGNEGHDVIEGGGGAIDLLFGNSGPDWIRGGPGVNLIFGNSEGDKLYGGDDIDELSIDLIFGNGGPDWIHAGAGLDLVFGNNENDVIYGDDGLDLLFGNSGDDQIHGGDGLDLVFGNNDHDTLFGDGGLDIIFGNSGNDKISGGGELNVIFGNAGDDTILGGPNADVIFGNDQNDTILAGDGNPNIVFGNGANDVILGGSNKDLLFGNSGSDQISGASGNDFLFGNGEDDSLVGGPGRDFLFGNRGNDMLDGNTSPSASSGDGTKDFLFGNRDDDTLFSCADGDFLFGGGGKDTKMRGDCLTLPISNDPKCSSIHGRKLVDLDGNGTADEGLPGISILLNPGGRSTVTMEDDPDTHDDEAGRYRFTGLAAGSYTITEIIPPGYDGDSDPVPVNVGIAAAAEAPDLINTDLCRPLPDGSGCDTCDACGPGFELVPIYETRSTCDLDGLPCEDDSECACGGSCVTETVVVDCECRPLPCQPTPDALDCEPVACPDPNDVCGPTVIFVNSATGDLFVGDCDCASKNACHLVLDPDDPNSLPECVGDCPDGGGSPISPIACNDDECATQSQVKFGAVAGNQYLIRIGTFPGAAGGSGAFSIDCNPLAQPCAQPASNCQTFTTDGASRSDAPETVADDFSPSLSGFITGICWWGSYASGSYNAPLDSFTITYYADAGGIPGALIAGPFAQSSGGLIVAGPAFTGLVSPDFGPIWEYTASHFPIAVSATELYWIEVRNQVAGGDYWLWQHSTEGNGQSARRIEPGGFEFPLAGFDQAWCLNLPVIGLSEVRVNAPSNDDCSNAESIGGSGIFAFNTTAATMAGPANPECGFVGPSDIDHDVWFCWTSDCDGIVAISTCGLTTVDTRIAVYDGCTCPALGCQLVIEDGFYRCDCLAGLAASDPDERPSRQVAAVAVNNTLVREDSRAGEQPLNAPLMPPSPHDLAKNRYVSFAPNNPNRVVAFEVVIPPCRKAWIGEPTLVDFDGANPAYVAVLVDDPVFRVWNEDVIHVGGCAVGPGRDYEIRATNDASNYSDPLVVSTVANWGDVAGAFDGSSWPPPDGVVDANDELAVLQSLQGFSTAPHPTRTDLGPQWPDYIVDQSDLSAVQSAINGHPFPPESSAFGTITECPLGAAVLTCPTLCGDLDDDGDVDGLDFEAFLRTYGRNSGQARFNLCADYDGDGFVSLVDYQHWLTCYRDFIGDPTAPPPQIGVEGDFDGDGDVDLGDFAIFAQCFGGSLNPPAPSCPAGVNADLDYDGDVDLADFSIFALNFGGSH